MNLEEWIKERYSRHLKLEEFTYEQQLKLYNSKVAIVGVGGLGSAAALTLAYAGIGSLKLIDPERLELSNLNRQILYYEEDIGRLKVEAARDKIKKINSKVNVECLAYTLTLENAKDLIRDVDVVIDGLDNFKSRYILADACWDLGKPFIHAGVRGFYGQLTVIVPGETRRFKELFPKVIDETGLPIFTATPIILGILEAVEAIKILTGIGRPLKNILLIVDLLDQRFYEVSIA